MENFQQIMDSAWAFVLANYLHVVAAVIILAAGWVLAGWARMITRKGLTRGEVDQTLIPFVSKLVYYAVLAVVVIAALNRLGVATTSVVAIFGAAGLAVGLALQWWTNAFNYPMSISGKPLWSIPANIPVAFELTILLAALATAGCAQERPVVDPWVEVNDWTNEVIWLDRKPYFWNAYTADDQLPYAARLQRRDLADSRDYRM